MSPADQPLEDPEVEHQEIEDPELEQQVLRAAEEAFATVMHGVREQVESMPPDLEPADALRWAGDRVTELLTSLADLPLERALGLVADRGPGVSAAEAGASSAGATGAGDGQAGEPIVGRGTPGGTLEVRVWVHPTGVQPRPAGHSAAASDSEAPSTPGLRFLLTDLVAATGKLIVGATATFAPAELVLPVPAGSSTLLRIPVPEATSPGTFHGHVLAQGAAGAAVPITVVVA